MAVFQRSETHVHHATVRDSLGVKTTPTTIKDTIYDPCGKILLRSAAMTPSATGEYYYNYPIVSTATYGRYISEVTVTDASGSITKDRLEFFVMPWDAVIDVRTSMGVESDSKSITDDVISHVLWSSYQYVPSDVFIHHYQEQPNGNPYTGALWDDRNTSFQSGTHPLADYNGDGTVSGSGVSCATDIFCTWLNLQGALQTGYVNVTNATNGEIALKQSNGTTPLPSSAIAVYLEYWEKPPGFTDTLFRQAVVYLACHKLSKRFTSVDKITIADLQKNNPVIILNPRIWWDEYQLVLRRMRGPSFGGVLG